MNVKNSSWRDDVITAIELRYPKSVCLALLHEPDEEKRQKIFINWRKHGKLPEVNWNVDKVIRLSKRCCQELEERVDP